MTQIDVRPLVRAEIETERLIARPVLATDVTALAAILRQPSVACWWFDYDAERARESFVGSESDYPFTVEYRGETVGLIRYTETTDADYRCAKLDIFLGVQAQGKGFGAEVLQGMLGYLFEEIGHHRVTIAPRLDNERAIAAYKRAGFRTVGVMGQFERSPDGNWHDGLLMEMLSDDFIAA
ncbi:MAG: GNAT family N-acetyltransferase [Actinobacteria bacterium]|nr:GNAT family N-acetyltransferase [Actinomycetota bacterium]